MIAEGGDQMRGFERHFWVYIVASKRNGTIYIGHTDDLAHRMGQHRGRTFKGFAAQYGCTILVWYEQFHTREQAFDRERQLKEWRRAWKIALIEQINPHWLDRSGEVYTLRA